MFVSSDFGCFLLLLVWLITFAIGLLNSVDVFAYLCVL